MCYNVPMMRKTIIIFVLAVFAAFAVLLLAAGPNLTIEKVKHLKLEQVGSDLNISWDAMDCDAYDLVVMCENERTALVLQENHYTIRDIKFDKTYRVTVDARLKVGSVARGAKAEITTERLKQKLKLSIKQYDGFKGDTFRIEAKGEGGGDIGFASTDKKIAAVSKNGTVKLKKPGQVKIEVTASGDAVYQDTTNAVAVNVYPDKLTQPAGLKTKNVSDTRCKLTWKPTDLATHYQLFKQNAHTEKYEHFRDIDTEDLSVEITRDTGNYAVKAFAEVGDKTISSPMSKPVKVTGTFDKASSYSSARNIMTLNSSNLDLLRQINGDGGTKVPQSISNQGDCYVVSYVNHAGSAGKLVSYRKSDCECVAIDPCSGMGHANGATYNPNTNKFYVVKTHRSLRTASCSTYDGTTKKSAGTFNLPRVTSGIAYDESNDKYYLSKGNEIYVCSDDFTVEKFIHKFIRYNHAQDIGAYNGVVFVCTWVSGNTSYIDLYRASDGAYLGSYDVSIGEIESCIIDDGYLVILMNTVGSSKDRIYRTKERISLP